MEKCTERDDDKLHLEMDALIGQKVALSVSEFVILVYACKYNQATGYNCTFIPSL